MEFRHLHYVLKVAEERSFSNAAKKMYISQPALSQYISNLEQQLGIQLFNRTTAPLTLTYAGEVFVEKARTILNMRNELSLQIEDLAGFKTGRLTIGITPIRSSYLLPKILPVFIKRFPGIEINLVEGSAHELEEWAFKGMCDLSILLLPINSEMLAYDVIQHEELLVALHPKHPLLRTAKIKLGSQYPQLSLSCLQGDLFILPKQGHQTRRIIDSLFKEAGYSPKILLETNSLYTEYALITKGLATGFSFSTLTQFQHESEMPVYCSLEHPAPVRSVAIAYKAGKYISKIEHEFIAITKKVLD